MKKYTFTAGNAWGAGAAKPQPPEAHGITAENLLGSLPPVLAGAPALYALARAVAEVLAKRQEEIGRVSIYPHIDRLDGPLLDILARDFKVDWWDPDYALEEKRRTLAASWQVHKTLGTKAAVEKAISAIFPKTTVEEWFEYGGEPFHFRLRVNLNDDHLDKQRQARVLERIHSYKNLRSHLDNIFYFMTADPVALENWATQAVHLRRMAVRIPFYNGAFGGYQPLNGRRLLDGSWALGRPHWGIGLAKLGARLAARERPGAGRVFYGSGPATFRAGEALAARGFAAGIGMRTAEAALIPSVRFHCAARTANTLTVAIQHKDNWVFDGQAAFDGAHAFDGPLVREIV